MSLSGALRMLERRRRGRAAAPAAVTCSRCGLECFDHRARDGERVCILCVESELDRVRALHAADVETLHDIEMVCIGLGYHPDTGEPLTEWLHRRGFAARRGTTHAG